MVIGFEASATTPLEREIARLKELVISFGDSNQLVNDEIERISALENETYQDQLHYRCGKPHSEIKTCKYLAERRKFLAAERAYQSRNLDRNYAARAKVLADLARLESLLPPPTLPAPPEVMTQDQSRPIDGSPGAT